PDLVMDQGLLAREVLITDTTFGDASCAIVEGCVGGPGTRRLLRFSAGTVNQGQGELHPPPASLRPDLFEYSSCHGHYHFSGFASYELVDGQGRLVTRGRKQAYCMEDSHQERFGPKVACEPLYTCDNQGIQSGWSDVYGNDLDCQWIDITDVAPGT